MRFFNLREYYSYIYFGIYNVEAHCEFDKLIIISPVTNFLVVECLDHFFDVYATQNRSRHQERI